jgi:glucose/arabinose dehydrogenase
MAFVGPDDILVLEKDTGMIKRIVNGKVLPKPVLDVNVANSVERCLCGIAVSKNGATTYVFIYYTQIDGKDGEDKAGKQPIGNRVYRYELSGDALINPVLLMDLPANPGPRHNGGNIIIGPDNNLYVAIGDVDGSFKGPTTETKTQNYNNGIDPDGRSGILRITQNGQPTDGILGDSIPLRLYYAYGIRNSFGMDFDPISGNLWDTENGPGNGDEINLVLPGFNSGWQQVQGLASLEDSFSESDLQNFNGKGHYSDPELVWVNTAGPTAVKFLKSTKLGTTYENDMFVGDVHNGRIYHFDLTPDRKDLILPQELSSRVIEKPTSPGVSNIVFGEGFGGITDLEVGPDGNLYVVSIGLGSIYQISPAS